MTNKKPQLTFVTGNKNKLREVQQILQQTPDFPFEVVNKDLDVPEIQGTTQEVARAKCRAAAQLLGGPCITEDTALSFTALSGLPGPYIKSFLSALGHSGLNKLLDGFDDRSATAICTFAYSPGPGGPSPGGGSSSHPQRSEEEILLFEGRTAGKIVDARGKKEFGWDPIIEIDGTGKTYAEMADEEKNAISHRYKALALLRDHLTKNA